MPTPTLGARAHFHEAGQAEPCACIITRVHTEDLVNVHVFHWNGGTRDAHSVPVLASAEGAAGDCVVIPEAA